MLIEWNIGAAVLKNPVIAAPLAGITDKVFRRILEDMGVGFCFTEMVSAKALIYQNKKTHAIMDIKGEEDVCGIQLFGPDPNEMAIAAKMAEDRGAKIIDINMGCPVPKVVNNGEGSALLKDMPRALKIAEAVVKAVKVPVTVKLRRGFDGEGNGIALAKELPSVGIQALTIHGRDRTQYYSGKADWEAIAEVKRSVKVPVIGNGDIFSPQDADAMMKETGCDGVMLARGILGNPWLVRDCVASLAGKQVPETPAIRQRIDLAIGHLEESCGLYGEWMGVRYMRKFLGWYIKGFRDAAKMRHRINGLTEMTEIKKALLKYADTCESSDSGGAWDASVPSDL